MLIQINLIGFLPEAVRTYFGITSVGVAEFFSLLYLAYEIVSILKNMVLCGLPVKKVWEKIRGLLEKYTKELPDTEEIEKNSTLKKKP
jgi:phage-related holin